MKKIFFAVLAVIVLCLASTAGQAVEIGLPGDLAAGANLAGTEVYFGSFTGGSSSGPILWYVVDTDHPSTVTLWTTTNMGNRAYDNTPSGSGTHKNWSVSDICLWLNNASAGFLTDFSAAEQGAIGTYGTTETGIYKTISINQKIVLPSVAEIGNGTVTGDWYIVHTGGLDGRRGFGAGNEWWLRSPGITLNDAAYVSTIGSVFGFGNYVGDTLAVRPALKINLSSVLFTSAASVASGKNLANVGGGLSATNAPTGAVKFTVQSASQNLQVLATTAQSTQSGSTLTFGYQGATPGTSGTQFISCVLQNGSSVQYYGKLVDSSATTAGILSVPLAGVTAGTYTLKIFSEQTNGDNLTDFASAPVSMTVVVDAPGGAGSEVGTVSNFGGTILGVGNPGVGNPGGGGGGGGCDAGVGVFGMLALAATLWATRKRK